MQVKYICSSENSLQRLNVFAKRSVLRWLPVVFIFSLALAIRVHKLEAPGLALDREYRSALIARDYYFGMTNSVPDWRRDAARASRQRAGIIEPPVMELLVSLIYRIVNGEHLWIARLLTSMFWLIGGVFLLKVAQRIMCFEAAIFATAYYLLVPLGVLGSRSFQPDSLMIMLFLVSLFAIVRHDEQPTMRRLVVAALISGFTILIRPLVLFALLSAFVSLAIYRKITTSASCVGNSADENGMTGKIFPLRRLFKATGGLKGIIEAQFLIFIVVSLLPTAFFYGYGMFLTDMLEEQAEIKFLPQLLLLREYWKGWLLTAAGSVGYIPFIAGLAGLPLLRQGAPRVLLIGLWLGYFVFGLVFHNQIRFVEYYHLQLIVIIALSVGPIIGLIINHLRQSLNQWYWGMPVIAALTLLMLFTFREVNGQLTAQRLGVSEAVAQKIGEIVGHSHNVAHLAHHYGTPLEYYGELSGTYWPRRLSDRERTLGRWDAPGRTIEERLQSLGFSPEYFVITDFDQFNRNHADLKEYLANNCQLVAKSDRYLIYGTCIL